VDKQRLAESRGPRWTRAEDYVAALARRRSARHNRGEIGPGSPDALRSVSSTLPFLSLLVLLGILAVSIMVVAFPGNQPRHQPNPPDSHELGTANRGWFQEARKQFR